MTVVIDHCSLLPPQPIHIIFVAIWTVPWMYMHPPPPGAAPSTPGASGSSSPAVAPSSVVAGDANGPPSGSDWEAFNALDLRVGKIVGCEKHPDADRWVGDGV